MVHTKSCPQLGMEDSLNSSRVVHPHRHWKYVWLPLVGAAVWFGRFSPIDILSQLQNSFSIRDALGNVNRLVSPGSTAICVTRRIYCLYIRYWSKRPQASFYRRMCNHRFELLSHSCSGKDPQTHRTVKLLISVYSSGPLTFISIHAVWWPTHADEKQCLAFLPW